AILFNICIIPADHTLIRVDKAGDGAQQTGLTAAVGSLDHQEFAATDGEIQALEEAAITADERQVLARQFSHSRCLRRVDSQARPWKGVGFGCNYSHLGTLVNA